MTGLISPFIVILAMIALIGLIVFTIWELTERHPVVNIQIFKYRGFTISVLALAFGFGAFFGSIVTDSTMVTGESGLYRHLGRLSDRNHGFWQFADVAHCGQTGNQI